MSAQVTLVAGTVAMSMLSCGSEPTSTATTASVVAQAHVSPSTATGLTSATARSPAAAFNVPACSSTRFSDDEQSLREWKSLVALTWDYGRPSPNVMVWPNRGADPVKIGEHVGAVSVSPTEDATRFLFMFSDADGAIAGLAQLLCRPDVDSAAMSTILAPRQVNSTEH